VGFKGYRPITSKALMHADRVVVCWYASTPHMTNVARSFIASDASVTVSPVTVVKRRRTLCSVWVRTNAEKRSKKDFAQATSTGCMQ
jgi:hypothetical protein